MDPQRPDEDDPASSVFDLAPPVVPPPIPDDAPLTAPPAGVTIGPERDVPIEGISAGPLIEPEEAQPLDLDSLYGTGFEPDPDNAEPPEIIVDKIVRDSSPLAGALGGLVGAAFLGATWFGITRGDDPLVPADQLASPQDTWDAFLDLYDQDIFLDSILATVEHAALALIVGGVIGALIGTVAGSLDIAHAVLRPIVGFVRWVSPAMIYIVVLLRWGVGDEAVWLPAAAATASAVAWSTTSALLDSRRRLAKNQAQRLVEGVRAALPITWAVIYFAEFIASSESVGGQAFLARSLGDVPTIYVYIITALVMALVVDAVLRIAQHSVRDS